MYMNGFVKKTLIFVFAMATVAAVCWTGRKVYKKGTEHRLLAKADRYLEQKDFRNASLCLQRALQLNPLSVEACSLTADMLEASGASAALTWRIRTVQLRTNGIGYRFAWARTALKFQEPQSAAQALSGVDEKLRSTAIFHKLAGALAWDLNDPAAAEAHFLAALQLEPTNETVLLNLSTARLA